MLHLHSSSALQAHAPSYDSEPYMMTAQQRSRVEPDSPPLASDSLLRGHKVVEIVHNGSLYKLQATKLGKLILTK